MGDAKSRLSKALQKFSDLEIALEQEDEESDDDFEDVPTPSSVGPEDNAQKQPTPSTSSSANVPSTSKPFSPSKTSSDKAKKNRLPPAQSPSKLAEPIRAWKPMQSSEEDPHSYSYAVKKLGEKRKS